jgi:Ala-tRNA(Pro) deacylase
MPATKVHALLDDHGVRYETHEHPRAVTAQRLAAAEHVSGWEVAKPVLVAVGDELAMVVVPAAVQVDLDKVSRVFGGNQVRLATEEEFAGAFPDCELGAEPPFGNLYDVPVFLDERLRARKEIVCRDGSHTEAITLTVHDYVEVVRPEIADLATDAPKS